MKGFTETILMVLVIMVLIAIGFVAHEMYEYNSIYYECASYGFPGGGRDYTLSEANEDGYVRVCFRPSDDEHEVVPLDWVRLNCTKNGECLEVKQ